MSKAVFCMVNSQDHADLIVNHLRDSGFHQDTISAILPDHKGNLDFALRHGTKAPEGATAGVTTGGIIGAGLGLLVGMGALTIPGVGPLLAAGPIVATLSGAAVGGAVGGIAGALVGMGIPEFEAKLYEGKVRAGGILIAVHTQDPEHARKAKEVFQDTGAHDIASAEPVHVKSKKEH
ncbi:MAG TPA: DUF3341 domain-containing protein [Fibrobacteria bacterium]|nr:DUF3341 domain-containing protein [Fibrobacteria bacterium]